MIFSIMKWSATYRGGIKLRFILWLLIETWDDLEGLECQCDNN